MFMLAMLYCIFVAAVRREHLFGQSLTHLDEAVAYAMVARLAAWVS